MSAACRSKDKFDWVMQIINQQGNRWRYEYKARKSAILVYGENKWTRAHNAHFRNLSLGGKKIPEMAHYDHVGVKACIYENDATLVEEKMSN